jgi:hypothetical protein
MKSAKWSSKPLITKLLCNNGVSIPPSVFTAVSWDTLLQDDVGAFRAGSTLVTPLGINRVRFQLRTTWQAVNNGFVREMSINKAGVGDVYNWGMSEQGTWTSLNEHHTTGWYFVNPGDAFVMFVFQNRTTAPTTITFSPGPGNGNGQAWWQAEWGVSHVSRWGATS